jgi:DNA replication licensing factor MCM5
MDRQSAYTLSVFPEDRDNAAEDSRAQVQDQLVNFILEFHVDNAFIYRDQIRENVLSKRYFCDVDMTHLIAYDEHLAHRLNNEPGDLIPLVRF